MEKTKHIHSLRTYLEVLELAGQLTLVKKPVSLVHELADVATTLARKGGGRVLFEQVENSGWPIFTNAIVNQNEAALALGYSLPEVIERMGFAIDPKNGISPSTSSTAVWKQNILQDEAVDLDKLPIPPYTNGFAAVVQIQKSNPGESKNVCMAAFTAHVNIKEVIVVDPDVNIYDPADVLWADINRVDWSKDVFFVPGAQGHEMDPTSDARGVHTKIGIDATYKPERRDYGERIRYQEVDLSHYI